ncbi:transglycosylase SLT domain-containing protein [Rhodobacteraceae bacterium 2CG4]|uniref:Transglycosylase SLT domain-containing protein n=1 Tax=Halovulum marinum TaxID=2662447 RepID=A0A6L5YX00_9RHOB|nr:transglycosylase SLT domain-containing protein [Halovulum marinum]
MAFAICLSFPVTAAAEEPSGFTFKRVKPPPAGAGKLITIQIEPVVKPVAVLDHKPDLPPVAIGIRRKAVTAPSSAGEASWFWALMSPALSDAGFSKMSRAVQVLGAHTVESAAMTPHPALVARIVETWGAEILKATAGTQVSPALVASVIAIESAGNPTAKSRAGAVGLMQLMPATARRFGVTDRTDPAQSIRAGVAYLAFLLDEFRGDALLALAGYNAGEGAVRRNGGVPNYTETRAYVPKVVAAWSQARALCLAPPVRVTDGCLFTGLEIAAR